MKLPLLVVKRYFPIFNSFLIFVFALLAIFLFNYSLIYFLIFVSLAVVSSFLLTILILGKEIKQNWPLAVIFPIFVAGFNLFLIFSKSQSLKVLFIFLVSLFSFIFLTSLFRFLYEPRKYSPYALENVSSSLGFITLAVIYSNFFALINFFNFSIFLSLLIIFGVSFFGFLFIFWLFKITIDRKSLLISALILTQVFYALTFLPTSFYINGIVLGLFSFVITSLFIRKNKEGILLNRVIKKHVILIVATLILIFLLAKWR